MKLFFQSPFIAPDIADLLTERATAWRRLLVMVGAGSLFVVSLLGGYYLATMYMAQTNPPASTAPDAQVSTDEDAKKRAILEQLPSTTEQPYAAERRIVSDLHTEDAVPASAGVPPRGDILLRLKSAH